MKTKRLDLPASVFSLTLTLVIALLIGGQVRSDAQAVVWIEEGDLWNYYQVGDEPANDGAGKNWKQVGYNDTSWESGQAQLGFNEGDEATLMEKSSANITYYFRHTMNVTQSQLNMANQLVINLLRDDGAIVYINGVEIRRDNMDVPDPVTSDTLASATVGGGDEDAYYSTNHLSSAFQVGLNTVAVELHQSSAGSSDISFGMTMEGFSVTPILGVDRPPVFINFEEVGPGLTYWDPFFEDEFELGWDATVSGSSSFVAAYHPYTGQPLSGFDFGQCFAVTHGSAKIFTQVSDSHPASDDESAYRVNVSNYKDVSVQFGLRAWAANSALGMNSGHAKFYIGTSVDGAEFDGLGVGDELLNMSGGPVNSITETLVSEDDTKKVWVPTASIGNAWWEVGFDDSSWTSGVKGTGYERSSGYDPFIGPTLDMEAQMYGNNGSVYMRVPFTVADPSVYTGLQLHVKYDDGFVAYINGQEVARKFAPAGVPDWNAEGPTNHPDPDAIIYEPFVINQHLNKLVAGNNILAIHGLNQPASSSDMLLLPELKGVLPGGGGGDPNAVPTNLNSIARPINGPYTTFKFPVPDQAQTIVMKWDLSSSSGDNALFLDNVLVTGTPLTPDSYGSWVALTTGFELDDEGAPGADPDGDSVINALEYAFGGSATVPDLDLTPVMSIVEVNGNEFLAMTWRQLNLTTTGSLVGELDDVYNGTGGYHVRDIHYIPQFSTDGQNWQDGVRGFTTAIQVGEIPEPAEGSNTVQVTARYKTPISGTQHRLYGRVKIVISGSPT